VTPEAAGARATEVSIEQARANPQRDNDPGRVQLVPVTDRFFGEDRESPVPAWLLGVTAVVLLVACANCSNLLLARGAGRRRELAVRAAMGASRGRLVRLLLTEGLLLAAVGGAAGLLLSVVCSRLLYLFDLPPLDPVIDIRVLSFSMVVATTTGLLVGLWPAVRLSRADVGSELKAATPGATRDRSRMRAALTVVQVALSIVLLVNAGLFVRSLRNVSALDAGFDFERLLVVSTRFERGTPAERVQATKEAAVERLSALPGVDSATLTSAVPYGTGLGMSTLNPEAWGLPAEPSMAAATVEVDESYFATVGLPVRAGRSFNAADRAESGRALMINEELARRMGGDDAALGKCIPAREGCTPIVGIVADARFSQPLEETQPAVYRALGRQAHAYTIARAVLLVRSAGEAASLADPIREELLRLDSGVRYVEVESVADVLAPKLQPWRIAMSIFTLFGGLAFLLATVGLYSVIAYLVAARRPEISIRMALGAGRGRIRGLVLGEGARLVSVGGVLGLLLALGASRLLEHRMYAVQPTDPLTYALVTLIMTAAALGTTFLSAERAARVDPNLALRND
jgi:predicted permease